MFNKISVNDKYFTVNIALLEVTKYNYHNDHHWNQWSIIRSFSDDVGSIYIRT